MLRKKLKRHLHLAKDGYKIFAENHPVKFASAIAYFSLFALPSIFLIIVFFLSFIYSQEGVLNELKDQLGKVVGDDGAEILVTITNNYEQQASKSIITVIIYSIIVFWLSTQLFRLFQNSLNDLWRIKPEIKNFWKRIWVQRGITFILVIVTGLLFFGSLALERTFQHLAGFLISNPDDISDAIDIIVNIVTAVFVFLWFSVLYKVLPAVKIKWEPTLVGAGVTTILFYIGIWLLWNFVVERDLENIYDLVAPIIVVALWVFYSSLVFLFGASFTKAYARQAGKQIAPEEDAFKYKLERDDAFYDKKEMED